MPFLGNPQQVIGPADEAKQRLAAILMQRQQAMEHGGNDRGYINMPNNNEAAQLRQLDSAGGFVQPPSPNAMQVGAKGAGIDPATLAAALKANPNLTNFQLPEEGGAQLPY